MILTYYSSILNLTKNAMEESMIMAIMMLRAQKMPIFWCMKKRNRLRIYKLELK